MLYAEAHGEGLGAECDTLLLQRVVQRTGTVANLSVGEAGAGTGAGGWFMMVAGWRGGGNGRGQGQ